MSINADESEPTLVIDQRTTQRVPADWSEAIMRSAGVSYIAEARDEAGELIGYDIAPPLTTAAYNAAAAAYVPPVSPVRLSFLEFMDLFTGSEQLELAGAAMTDAPTKLWYDRAVGAQFIDLSDARLATGLQAMVDASIISADRKARVLQGLAPEG